MDNGFLNSGGVWLAIALINAGLAEQKNRSRLAWFFISVFFGPLATLLIVVMHPAAVATPRGRR
ncbi:hypothetical protein ACFRAU_24985 [Arthrobacter sp. NPDC056691]|uniref:hypothetical protein n=1 Tax=Arthrobacter sp. NPDC056691 TaxID=3345913 RepID=UPI00366A7061